MSPGLRRVFDRLVGLEPSPERQAALAALLESTNDDAPPRPAVEPAEQLVLPFVDDGHA
jgi:hypothetical protein